MKKTLYFIFLSVIAAATFSCRKNMQHETKQIVIDTVLAASSEYVLDLKPFGDADDVATILKQASAFSTSEITNTSATFAPVYHYAATTKTSVSDQVVLAITEGNSGRGDCRHRGDSTIITINFLTK